MPNPLPPPPRGWEEDWPPYHSGLGWLPPELLPKFMDYVTTQTNRRGSASCSCMLIVGAPVIGGYLGWRYAWWACVIGIAAGIGVSVAAGLLARWGVVAEQRRMREKWGTFQDIAPWVPQRLRSDLLSL